MVDGNPEASSRSNELSAPTVSDKSRYAEHQQSNWLLDNILKPAGNAAIKEPINAIANVLNAGDLPDWCPKVQPWHVQPAKLGSSEWFAQTAASGIGMLAPYTIAGKLAGGAMHEAGARLGTRGSLARLLKSDQAAMIGGAAAFDYARDTRPGETRAFNALAGATAFGVFGLGNRLSHGLELGYRLPAMALTGAVGGTTQTLISRLPSGEMASKDDFFNAAASGAMMNSLLPPAQAALHKAGSTFNDRIGRGNLHDRYIADHFPEVDAHGQKDKSATNNPDAYRRLADQSSPWLRVIDGKGPTSYFPAANKINMTAGERSLERLQHELEHHVQDRNQDFEPNFKAAAELLSTAKPNRAWLEYQDIRRQQECQALLAQGPKSVQNLFKAADKPVPAADNLSAELVNIIPELKVTSSKTYGDVWQAEFEKFVDSNGAFRPQQEFAPEQKSGKLSADQWQKLPGQFASLDAAQKLLAIEQIGRAPGSVQKPLLSQGMRDGDVEIRFKAIEKIAILPENMRMRMFNELLHSDSYSTRIMALHQIDKLPASERPRVFRGLIDGSNNRLLKIPKYDSRDTSSINRSSLSAEMCAQLYESPANILMSKLDSLNSANRAPLWNSAFRAERTRTASIGAIHHLPPQLQAESWSKSWDELASNPTGRLMSFNQRIQQQEPREALLKEIPKLSEDAKATALQKVLMSNESLSASALSTALTALPEQLRYPFWQKIHLRSSADRQEHEHKFELDHTSDKGTAGIERGLGMSIEALPAGDRASAWWQLTRLDNPPNQLTDLFQSVRVLPESERLPAIEYLLHKAKTLPDKSAPTLPWQTENKASAKTVESLRDSVHMENALRAVPLQDWPGLMDSIGKIKDSAPLRDRLISNFPTKELSIDDMPIWHDPANQRTAKALKNALETAQHHIVGDDYSNLHSLWENIDEPLVRATSNFAAEPYREPTPVRDYLADNLKADLLARIVFGDAHTPEFATLMRNNPSGMRAVIKELNAPHEEQVKDKQLKQLNEIAAAHLAGEPLVELARKATAAPEMIEIDGHKPEWQGEPIAQLVGQLAKKSPHHERQTTFAELLKTLHSSDDPVVIRQAADVALLTGNADPDHFQSAFAQPLNSMLSGRDVSFTQRLLVAREFASLERQNRMQSDLIEMPSFRMPADTSINAEQATGIQKDLVAALRTGNGIESLLGNGELGRLFPPVFGHYKHDGGIVGRPQHSGHELPVDGHTLLVIKHIRENQDFKQLSERQQEDLLLAGLMHDAGKRANMRDPDHEDASARIAWGILGTLGYDPVRIARITDLIARHSELGYLPDNLPSNRLSDKKTLDDLAVHYRRPAAPLQLRIFNESDSRSIDKTGSYWTPEVKHELDQTRSILAGRVDQLNKNSIPLLTSELPRNFGIYPMKDSYAVLGHVSPDLNLFLKQMALAQTPEYSISASLLTPNHKQLFQGSNTNFVALISTPHEHISQIYRDDLYSESSWEGHVAAVNEWAQKGKTGSIFAAELENKLAQIGFPQPKGKMTRLTELRRGLDDFTSIDDAIRQLGADHRYVQGAWTVIDAVTKNADGTPLNRYNEADIINGTLSAIGVIRRHLPIIVENAEKPLLTQFLNGGPPQKWLRPANESSGKAVVIPQSLWQITKERNIPFMVLDP